MIDEPNKRMATLRLFKGSSTATTVHLVCQRPTGVPAVSKSYEAVSVPISIKPGFGGVSLQATMPTLQFTLQEYSKKSFRIASIYNPPSAHRRPPEPTPLLRGLSPPCEHDPHRSSYLRAQSTVRQG